MKRKDIKKIRCRRVPELDAMPWHRDRGMAAFHPCEGDTGPHSADSSLTPGSEASQALSTDWAHFLRICGFSIPEKTLDRRMRANGSSSGI